MPNYYSEVQILLIAEMRAGLDSMVHFYKFIEVFGLAVVAGLVKRFFPNFTKSIKKQILCNYLSPNYLLQILWVLGLAGPRPGQHRHGPARDRWVVFLHHSLLEF